MTQINDLAMATSSDEFPVGMTFTREKIQNPLELGIDCNKGTLYKETCSMCTKKLLTIKSKETGTCNTCRGDGFNQRPSNYRLGDDSKEDALAISRNNPRY